MRYFIVCGLLLGSWALSAQSGPPGTEAAYEAEYARRIRQDMLYNVYIPADLGEAFVQLNKLTDAPSRAIFKQTEEREAVQRFFFSFGRWIIHNWGFYGGSRFSHYLTQLGLSHPEDMAVFTMVVYHRHLNQQPLDPRPVVEELLERRREEARKRRESGVILEERTTIKPPAGEGGQR